MKRFINIGNQGDSSDENLKEFSFYCTVKEAYEVFEGVSVWDSVSDFKADYLSSGGSEINRYLSKIPNEFIGIKQLLSIPVGDVVSSYLIRFHEMDAGGNTYLPDSVSLDCLNNLKISGEIIDYEIDDKGIRVIKDFKIISASICK